MDKRWLRGPVWLCLLPFVTGAVALTGLPVGGTLSPLAFPIGFVVAIGVACWREGWRGGLGALLWAFATFLLADAFALGGNGDYFLYHFPQLLLLEEGWNPALQGMAESVEALGLDFGTVRPFHVFFLPIFFSAWGASVDVAQGSLGGFVWAPFLFLPLLFAQGWRLGKVLRPDGGRWFGVMVAAAVCAAGYRGNPIWNPIDAFGYVLQATAILSLVLCVRAGSRAPLLWMAFCTLLLLSLKPSNGLFCAAVWGFCLLGLLSGRRWADFRLTLFCLFPWMALSTLALNFHPYLTNWVTQGGPFFPFHSFTQDVGAVNILADLGDSPEGAVPSLRAFVASRLFPFVIFPLVMTALLGWIRRPLWPLLGMVLLLCAFLTPSRCYGYGRYYLWLPLLPVLLGCMLAEKRGQVANLAALGVLTVVIVCFGAVTAVRTVCFSTLSLDWYTVCRERSPLLVWSSSDSFFPQVYPPQAHRFASEALFARRFGLTLQPYDEKTRAKAWAFPDKCLGLSHEEAKRLGLEATDYLPTRPPFRATLRLPVKLARTIVWRVTCLLGG